ncbi:helix-turn-helix domain-containing protein [Fructobacillus sp. M1-13]|uniref:Helix-turn-helix transcriptional regulator n=1 Tax=Fructobacillus papyriferae TaxID=2713171 RepID=A0ABS5QRH6_9LACO|nr:helix-turn-helix transcriptional regulator [Fructobacillus papyriferae]MBS9335105.1 helix-turn-helix transcriptional regulator [Fructobacillus papyriferae]MCD2159409.1 helix-turn-helix domain-containing protein [Fructobacillus papyriferae]
MSFEKDIKQLREEHSLTQQDLADKVHVSRQTVSTWERGKNYPSLEVLRKLSDLFGLSFEKLVFGEDHMTKKDDTIANRVDGDRMKKKWYKNTTLILATVIGLVVLWAGTLTFGYAKGVEQIDRVNPFLGYQTAYTKLPAESVVTPTDKNNGRWTGWFTDNMMGNEWWKLTLATGVNPGYDAPYVMVIHKGSFVKTARIVPGDTVNELNKADLQAFHDFLANKDGNKDTLIEANKFKKKKHVKNYMVRGFAYFNKNEQKTLSEN